MTGYPHASLLELKWRDLPIEEDEKQGIQATKKGKQHRKGEKVALPSAMTEAIMDYLRASGRLTGMQPDHYIFAPRVNPIIQESQTQSDDWDSHRHLQDHTMLKALKGYGRWAGLPEEKLTLNALLHTAAVLRLEAGDSIEEIQAFLGKNDQYETARYLRALMDKPMQLPREGQEKRNTIRISPKRNLGPINQSATSLEME